jgi:hypothetical protein
MPGLSRRGKIGSGLLGGGVWKGKVKGRYFLYGVLVGPV